MKNTRTTKTSTYALAAVTVPIRPRVGTVVMNDTCAKVNLLHEDYVYQEYDSLVELNEVIDGAIDYYPDKRTKQYKQWKDEINKLITQYNERVKFKCFNFVK